MSNTMIIGVTGASASGKSLLSHTIVEELGSDQVAIISEDSYYKGFENIPLEERIKINYDHPDSLEHTLLCEHLRNLLNGDSVEVPIYDYAKYERKKETRTVGSHKIIVLEGILLFVVPELRELMDVRIFMDTSLDICLTRRIQRDVVERGRTIDSVLHDYQTTVRPMYMQFIEPCKRHADIIVPRGGMNRIAIEMIKAKMRESLS
ncbi:MAG: uridine kinase [Gammaproteobacteria bacterium]|nr:uridine kinase [Gammaproteobacteria bacterium]